MGLRFTALALAGLLVTGLIAASPYLCDRLVGTGEAYNYSLSVADATEQMQAGIVPPLAGQSVYAFNGRIHPLRNAPYMFYLCAAIDGATLHRLTPWEIQNISLIMSLVGAGLACFVGLHWGLGCPRMAAFLLSAAYGLSPPLLGAAYTFNLFMTVHVAVFVPLAVASCLRGILRPSFSADVWLASAVAAAWLTHPPVALWLTGGVVLVRLIAFCIRPTVSAFIPATLAIGLAGALSAFVFASATTLTASTGALSLAPGLSLVPLIMVSLRDAFTASLLPVARDASALSSLQLGYVAWLLFAATVVIAVRGIRREGLHRNPVWTAIAATLVFVLLLLLLAFPVPFLTERLWCMLPGSALQMTTIWPMQRLYLVATAFTLAAAALAIPRCWNSLWHRRWHGVVAILIAGAWLGYEAEAYLGRGFGDRRSDEETHSIYRSSNIDLTETSYAYVGFSPTYVSGVMDPQFEFRLLRNGTDASITNLASAASSSPTVKTAAIFPRRRVEFTLAPGKRYLLSFAFKTKPTKGSIFINGKYLHRIYLLPSAGAPEAFGMNDGQPRAIPLWTDSANPETVDVFVDVPETSLPDGRTSSFADLSLQQVDTTKLPIRLLSLVPLKFSVNVPSLGYTVETPRSFIPGYVAKVNGQAARVLMSPGRQVMVPVPAGESIVELECKGPALIYHAFWLSASAWACLFAWRLTGSRQPSVASSTGDRIYGQVLILFKEHRVVAALILAALAAFAIRVTQEDQVPSAIREVGPISIDFTLPYGRPGSSQPLLSTGKPGAGAVVFVHLIDERHIRICADVWGALYQSEPQEVDFSAVQTLVISESPLFPLEDSRVKALRPREVDELRGNLRVDLNGVTVLARERFAFDSTPEETMIGHTRFVSTTEPDFTGDIIGFRRLAISRALTTAGSGRAHLKVKFPDGPIGRTEPLVSVSSGASQRECLVTYLGGGKLRIFCINPENMVLDSAVVEYDPLQEHSVEVSIDERNDHAPDLAVGCEFDGRTLFVDDQVHPPQSPIVAISGLTMFHIPGVWNHFSGTKLNLVLKSGDESEGPPASNGPEHLVVRFPSNRPARQEPLLVSGHTGKADVIYVIYEDTGHIRLGYDHWAVGGAKSKPIPIDYTAPHEIWILMDSLGSADPASSTGPTRVYLDGKLSLESTLHPYDVPSEEIVVGKNQIGASTADPEFSGTVEFAERAGSKRPIAETR